MRYTLRRAIGLTATMAATVAVLPFCCGVAAAAPVPHGVDAGAAGAGWTATEDGPQRYPNVHIDYDVPIAMSDGVVLRANIYRPADAAGAPVAARMPTILTMTPYTKLLSALVDQSQSVPGLSDAMTRLFRNLDLTGTPFSGITDLTKAFGNGASRFIGADRQLIRSGYTQMVVDVRGTGFSQGDWGAFSAREQQDTVETIAWAAHRPYSNGTVGMSGESYLGINQMQAAEHNPPALKAIFPVVPGTDLLQDVAAPGGGIGVTFIPLWLGLVNGSKLIPDLGAALRGQFDTKWLADRAADPWSFLGALGDLLTATRIDQLTPQARAIVTSTSAMRRGWLGDPTRIHIPTFITGGWHDLFTNSEWREYDQIPLPPGEKQLLMGNTYHANSGSEAGKPGLPPRLDVLQRAWFDHWLKGIDNGIQHYGPVTLRQQGGGWITAPAFTMPDATYRRLYLAAAPSGTTGGTEHDGSLLGAPAAAVAELTVTPTLSALCSNDMAQATAGLGSVLVGCAADDRVHETGALSFTGAPVAVPTSISGPIAVHLDTALDATDGYWTVTVDDVAPDGHSTVLGSGQLVSSMRRINPARSSRSADGDYTDPVPYTSLTQRRPTVPGRPTDLDIAIPGTNALIQPGHRIRVDVYAANFPKGMPPLPMLLESGLRPEHLVLNPADPSYVNIALSRADR